jgi:hypothetical protein
MEVETHAMVKMSKKGRRISIRSIILFRERAMKR